ncbi:hypothetical protein HY625_03250 [Candidatus Uhrbacteria bacterium]|nr:hypothetical protein [Candidatus Uhrbacteria bacterium]
MTDLEPVSDQELKWGYWYVTHREQLQRVGTIALVVLCVALWGYSLIRLGYLFFVEEPKTQAAVAALSRDLVNVQDRSRYQAQDMQVLATEAFTSPDGRADFYARLQNTNAEYAASFTFSFVYDGGATAPTAGYALPGSEMILTALGRETTLTVRNAQLILDGVSWKRVVGWEATKARELNFTVSDMQVTPIQGGARRGSLVTFTLANNTAYNFWSVEVPVLLLRGSRVAGANAIRLENIRAGEHRPVSLQWFDAPGDATVVDAVVQVNVLDPRVVQAPQ